MISLIDEDETPTGFVRSEVQGDEGLAEGQDLIIILVIREGRIVCGGQGSSLCMQSPKPINMKRTT